MLSLLQSLPPERYAPITYIAADTDTTSESRAKAANVRFRWNGARNASQREIGQRSTNVCVHFSTYALPVAHDRLHDTLQVIPKDATLLRIPRSREVGQSYVSAVWSTLKSFGATISMVARIKPDLLLVNGPGTCLPVCAAARALNWLDLLDARIVFVESVCRVTSLSLTGKILYALRLADQIQVQWHELKQRCVREPGEVSVASSAAKPKYGAGIIHCCRSIASSPFGGISCLTYNLRQYRSS